MAEATQILVPKESLPDCQVGELLKIVEEDDKGNFVLETQYDDETPAEDEGDESMPAAVKAVMG